MRMQGWRERPETWGTRRAKVRHRWAVPFVWVEHKMDWVAYGLGNWAFLEALEYLGSLGVLIAVIFYFAESGDRLKQKHYQAWQVINSAQGKGGNGGRMEALEELNVDGVSLVGVDLSAAFLKGVQLRRARLARANFDGADARDADLSGAYLEDASLRGANFRGARLAGATFVGSKLNGADLSGADLSGANLENADLGNAEMEGVKWEGIKSVKGANLFGVEKAPEGFVAWAVGHGAVRVGE
jgi:hypothetical protein